MPQTTWIAATQLLSRSPEPTATQQVHISEEAIRRAIEKQDQQVQLIREKARIAKLLTTLLKEKVALRLLKAANKYIVLAEDYDGGGISTVYFLDGKGLQQSLEPMETWTIYHSEKNPGPQTSPISAYDTVSAMVRLGMRPNQIIPFIEQELDKIAGQVLEMQG